MHLSKLWFGQPRQVKVMNSGDGINALKINSCLNQTCQRPEARTQTSLLVLRLHVLLPNLWNQCLTCQAGFMYQLNNLLQTFSGHFCLQEITWGLDPPKWFVAVTCYILHPTSLRPNVDVLGPQCVSLIAIMFAHSWLPVLTTTSKPSENDFLQCKCVQHKRCDKIWATLDVLVSYVQKQFNSSM